MPERKEVRVLSRKIMVPDMIHRNGMIKPCREDLLV
jgi:hypothetical protein